MRIVILSDSIPPESPGGAGKIAWQLACGLREAGHEVFVIAATATPAFEEDRDGIRTYHLHTQFAPRWRAYISLYNPQIIRQLVPLLDTIRPDVLNAHNVHESLSYHALTLARQMGIPVVFTAHDVMAFAYGKLTHFVKPGGCDMPREAYRLPPLYNLRRMRFRFNPFRNIMIRHVLSADVAVRTAVSHALGDALSVNGLPPFRVVHNGLDPAEFDVPGAQVEALRNRLGLQGKKVILFGGRLSREKGADQLLAAMDRVVQEIPTARLLILSRQPLDPAVLARAEYPHLDPGIVLSGGWLTGSELAAAYHLADVVVMPSVCLESFGMVALEGMAASRPVVASCFSRAASEIITNGETGYVIDPFDTARFSAHLTDLLQDDELRLRMGQAGRARLESYFTRSLQVSRMLEIFAQAITPQNAR